MSTLELNYTEIIATLHKAGINEDEYQWVGFIEGAIAKGLEPGSAELSKHISDILNGGQPIPGTLSAFLTTLGIKTIENFNKSIDEPFFFPYNKKLSVKLKCLSDLCSGLCLGLGLSPKGGMVKKIESADLTDFIHTLGNIADVDLESDGEAEDLNYIIDYMSTEIRRFFKTYPRP